MEKHQRTISGTYLRSCIRDINKINNGSYTQYKHGLKSQLEEKADENFNLYERGLLRVSSGDQQDFARYICFFGGARRDILLDKLQKEAYFNVREFLRRDDRNWWQKLFNIEKMKYLSASDLEKRIKKFDKARKDGEGLISINQTVRIRNLCEEANMYINAYNDGSYRVKPEDVSAFKEYVMKLGEFYKGSPAETALDKLESIPQQQSVPVAAVKKSKSSFFTGLKDKLKYAAVTLAAVVGSWFGINKFSTDTSEQKQQQSQEIKIANTAMAQPLANKTYFMYPQNIQQSNTNLFSSINQPMLDKEDKQQATVETMPQKDKHEQIWNNFYEKRLSQFTSQSRCEKMIAEMKSQIKNGVISLPEDISLRQYLYAGEIYKQYGFMKISAELNSALMVQEPLLQEQQEKLFKYVRDAGKKGVGVQKKAERRHMNNMKQIRKAHHRQ